MDATRVLYIYTVPLTVLLETIPFGTNLGFRVRAFVCNMAPSDRKLITGLSISKVNPILKKI